MYANLCCISGPELKLKRCSPGNEISARPTPRKHAQTPRFQTLVCGVFLAWILIRLTWSTVVCGVVSIMCASTWLLYRISTMTELQRHSESCRGSGGLPKVDPKLNIKLKELEANLKQEKEKYIAFTACVSANNYGFHD